MTQHRAQRNGRSCRGKSGRKRSRFTPAERPDLPLLPGSDGGDGFHGSGNASNKEVEEVKEDEVLGGLQS